MLTNNGAGIKTQVPQTALQHLKLTLISSNLLEFSEHSGAEEAEGQVNSQEKIYCLGSASSWESKVAVGESGTTGPGHWPQQPNKEEKN